MQTLSQMWGSAPGTFLLLAALAAALLMVVLSYVVDIIKAVIDGVIRLFHGYPESQRVSIPLDEDDSDFGEDDEDDEDEDHPGIGMTDRQMQCLADRLVGEIVPKALIEVSRHADLLDRLALKIADRQNELNADATADDALVAKIADAVRDRVNEVTVSATDLDLFAAKVMELADKRRAEREAAKKSPEAIRNMIEEEIVRGGGKVYTGILHSVARSRGIDIPVLETVGESFGMRCGKAADGKTYFFLSSDDDDADSPEDGSGIGPCDQGTDGHAEADARRPQDDPQGFAVPQFPGVTSSTQGTVRVAGWPGSIIPQWLSSPDTKITVRNGL